MGRNSTKNKLSRPWMKFRARKTTGKCRDCGFSQPVQAKEWSLTANPRCTACGGMLDRGGMWNGQGASGRSPSSIPYPEQPSEFEVHAKLYMGLRRMGIDARGCVVAKTRSDAFDIVIYDARRKPARLIEVKKKKGRKKKATVAQDLAGVHRTIKQVNRYEQYGLPVDLVCGLDEAEAFLLRAREEQAALWQAKKAAEVEKATAQEAAMATAAVCNGVPFPGESP